MSLSNNGILKIKTAASYVKQPDIKIKLSEVAGNTTLKLYKSSTYGSSILEPAVGDYILVKWLSNVSTITTTEANIIDSSVAMPYLFYKIEAITSGTLSTDNLIIQVDRNTPIYDSFGNTKIVGAFVFSGTVNNLLTYNPTSYLSDSILSFLTNTQCDITVFPFWNMSIVYTEEIAGITSTSTKYTQFKSNKYAGFVSYIQNQAPVFKKLGIIHYTNDSPVNEYAEGFYKDTAVLLIPTIMWHKEQDNKLGVVLSSYGVQKTLSGLTTTYYDLADPYGNIVGKVFNNLKLFSIEDQELLFAMSYKSNRSWTLPNYTLALNTALSNCAACAIDYTVTTGTGSISVSGIINNTIGAKVFLEILGLNTGTHVYQEILSSQLLSTTTISGIPVDSYTVTLYDLGSPNCFNAKNALVTVPATTTTTTAPATTTTTAPATTTTTAPPTTTTTTIPHFTIMAEVDVVNTSAGESLGGSFQINGVFKYISAHQIIYTASENVIAGTYMVNFDTVILFNSLLSVIPQYVRYSLDYGATWTDNWTGDISISVTSANIFIWVQVNDTLW